jgi:murein DD-endopeptidase MepM/ murein hydrolase activator NlpD
MAHGTHIIRKLYLTFSILCIVGIILFFIVRDKEGPSITVSPETRSVSLRPLSLDLKDENSGLRALEVVAIQKGKELPVLSRQYPDRPRRISESFALEPSQLAEGDFVLRVTAKDGAFLGGNATSIDLPLSFDKTPPVISVLSRTLNIRPGGSGLISYSLSEKVSGTGVKIGDRIFPAYLQPSGKYLCLLAFPYDVEKEEFHPLIFAQDPAGNTSEAGFYYHVRNGSYRHDQININDQFLNAKMPQFRNEVSEAQTPLDIFLKVNKEIRAKNREELHRYGAETAASFQFKGPFVRQPGKTMATFGDRRTYFYQGKAIDNQVHLGVDIASFVQSPIHAANSGKVIFTGIFGIYGKCIIIDHGLGLQSLYGHLSRIDVTVGQEVARDAVIGLSGATGMAGGDHLHFGVLISGNPVDPIEWWDPAWFKNNVEDRLADTTSGN